MDVQRDRDAVRQYGAEGVPLLPGEPPDSILREDVDHWVAVYEELTSFLVRLYPEIPGTLVRYQRRLDHWRLVRSQVDGPAARNGRMGVAE